MRTCRLCATTHDDRSLFCGHGHILHPDRVDDILLGRVLDERYEVRLRLGAGGFGTVYLASQLKLNGRPCVVKVAHPQLATDPMFAARFQREKKALMALRSHNTVLILDYGRTSDDIDYIVMEYIDGTGLDSLLKNEGSLPIARAMSIGLGICTSLEEAHGIGILHRDLKPSNVMLVSAGGTDLVKVIDFGIARIGMETAGGPQTRTGEMPLTPLYSSFEQMAGRVHLIDERSDIYSLGALLYEMISGIPPYGDSVRVIDFDSATLYFLALADAKANRLPTPLTALCQGGGEMLARIETLVTAMLSKDPGSRPRTVADVARPLGLLLGLTQPEDLAFSSGQAAKRYRSKSAFAEVGDWHQGALPASDLSAVHPGRTEGFSRQNAVNAEAMGETQSSADLAGLTTVTGNPHGPGGHDPSSLPLDLQGVETLDPDDAGPRLARRWGVLIAAVSFVLAVGSGVALWAGGAWDRPGSSGSPTADQREMGNTAIEAARGLDVAIEEDQASSAPGGKTPSAESLSPASLVVGKPVAGGTVSGETVGGGTAVGGMVVGRSGPSERSDIAALPVQPTRKTAFLPGKPEAATIWSLEAFFGLLRLPSAGSAPIQKPTAVKAIEEGILRTPLPKNRVDTDQPLHKKMEFKDDEGD